MDNNGLPYFMPWVWNMVITVICIFSAVVALVMICGA